MPASAVLPSAPRKLLAGLVEKQRAVAEVIGGRISLAEAAACFRSVSGELQTTTETACRSVIGWVDLALRERPERAERVVQRLEHELQSLLTRFGRLSVPE